MTQGLSEKVGTGFSVRQADTKNVPALRFPEFEGEWEDCKAGDAFTNSRAKGEAGLPLYSVTMDRGLVRRDSLDRHMHGDAADETNLRAQAGDIVYNMMRMWQGAAGIAKEECMVSPAYLVLAPKKQTSSAFFNYRIENARMLYLLWAYSHGLTSDRLRLYFSDFARIPMRQPSLPEQKKIAAFLGVVDAKIAALRARVEGLERYKRGLMQALFSQTLRFTKPDGSAFPDWEEKRLGELGKFIGGGTPDTNVLEYWSGEVPWISSSDVIEGDLTTPRIERWISAAAIQESATKIVPTGSILIVSRVGVGKLTIAPVDLCTSQDFINFIPKSDNVMFLGYWMVANTNALLRLCQGTSIKGLTSDDLKTLQVPIPHPDEQQKISCTLQAMDAKIAAVGDQIAQMEAFKKGLLQQIFV